MFMDLDHFKDVNDRLGHAAGDELLLQFTSRVQSCLREDDTLARLGGDEFIVLLPDLEQVEDAYRVAERLIARNQEPYCIDGEALRVGSSIGISLYPRMAPLHLSFCKGPISPCIGPSRTGGTCSGCSARPLLKAPDLAPESPLWHYDPLDDRRRTT